MTSIKHTPNPNPSTTVNLTPGPVTAVFPPAMPETDENIVVADEAAIPTLPTGTLFTLADIQAIIAGVLASQPQNNTAGIGAEIARAIREGMAANSPRRKVTIGEYDPKTAFHPNKASASHFRPNRKYYQNGGWIDEVTAFDREVDLLNQITHSGRYIDRIVEVVVAQNGSEESVDIRYNNRNIDQRLTNSTKWRNFTDMLEQIVTAQKEEDREMDELRADRDERRRVRMSAGVR